jgi:hypothetical protein
MMHEEVPEAPLERPRSDVVARQAIVVVAVEVWGALLVLGAIGFAFAGPLLDSVAYVELRRTDPSLLYVGLGLGLAGGIVGLYAATWEY